MARVARKRSIIKMHHVILRGIDKRNIFLSRDDYLKFLNYIMHAKDKTQFSMYAYCLMTNHIHMILKSDELGNDIRRIAVGYAQYHNNKYARTGHLFQNRFKSEPIEDQRYFLTVLRYIHQNPVKAGITKNIFEYQWSSYFEYFRNNDFNLIDTSIVTELFPDIDIFRNFLLQRDDEPCMEFNYRNKSTDEDLKKFICAYNFDDLDINSRNEIIKTIKMKTGASNRQLSRVLNLGRGILERIK